MKTTQKKGICRIGVMVSLFVIFLVVYVRIGFYYGINDDILMQELASGSITGIPNGHLVFIMTPLGRIIALLFKAFPEYDWYGILFLTILFICYWVIVCRILLGNADTYVKVIGLVIVAMLIIDSAFLFQFTLVTGVLISTAIFLLASSSKPTVKDWGCAWFLIILAGIIRKKIFFMSLPLIMVVYVGRILRQLTSEGLYPRSRVELGKRIKCNRNFIFKVLMISLIGVALFWGLRTASTNDYSYEPWKTYKEYLSSRSKIFDYYMWPSYVDNEDFWESLNISEKEHKCLRMYGVLANVDECTIEQVADYAKKSYERGTTFKEKIIKGWDVFIRGVNSSSRKDWKYLSIITGILVAIIAIKKEKTTKLELAAFLFMVAAEVAYLCYRGRMPDRIIAIFHYVCILGALGFFCSEGKIIQARRHKIISLAYLVFAICLCTSLFSGTIERIADKESAVNLYKESMGLFKQRPEDLFVIPNKEIKPEKKFTICQKDYGSHNTAGTYGWAVFSPWMDEIFARHNVDRHSNYLLDENVYMVVSDMSYVDDLNEYYMSEGITDAEAEIVDAFNLSNNKQLYFVKWHSPTE